LKFKFFSHTECEYFPCHKGIPEEDFNCLFCFCPLYHFEDCGGNYYILDNGLKDCSNCTIPNNGIQGYEYIIERLRSINEASF